MSEEEYQSILPEIFKENAASLRVMSVVCAFGLAGCFFYSALSGGMRDFTTAYGAAAFLVAIIAIVSVTALDKHPRMALPLVWAFQLTMLGFAAACSTVLDPGNVSVLFITFIVLLPLLFVDRPWRYGVIIVLCAALFAVLCIQVKSPSVYESDIMDVIVFGVGGIICGTYASMTKVDSLLLAKKVSEMSVTDALTGLGNRYAFNQDEADASELISSSDLTIVSIDVNGLKQVNDEHCHLIGDELLAKVAKCVLDVFAPLGKCYRLGGDEFVVVLESSFDDTILHIAQLQIQVGQVSLSTGEIASLSIGFARADEVENPTMIEILRMADKRMYKAKSAYYSKEGHDRRSR